MEEKKVLLSIRDLYVRFRVRGRILTAIRGVSLDIYENESIAIVGESGCGKSVLTKTFAGMLDNNGFIDQGDIIFNDEEFTETVAPVHSLAEKIMAQAEKKLNEYSKLELGAKTYQAMRALEKEKQERLTLDEAEQTKFETTRKELVYRRTEAFNRKQAYDRRTEKGMIREAQAEIDACDRKIKALDAERKALVKDHTAKTKNDAAYNKAYAEKMAALKAQYRTECAGEISEEIDPALFAFFFDNLLMMLHFSYSCDYYEDRFRIYCGDDIASRDEDVRRQLLMFIGGALYGTHSGL